MYNTINSSENKKYKRWLKLLKRKYRDSEGVYLIEGYKLIEEAVKNNIEIEEIILDSEADSSLISKLEELIICSKTAVYVLDTKLYRKLAQMENGVGIMAVVSRQDYTLKTFSECKSKNRKGCSGNLVVLDRLQDPGNIGTIIRTADGAGFGGLVVMKGTGDIYSPKVVRSAVGSIFRLPVLFASDNDELGEILDFLGKRMIVTCFDTDNYHYDADLSEDAAIVIGNEGRGVSEELIENADVRVKIPMYGNIDSLNASVAAGILMYESVRQSEIDSR